MESSMNKKVKPKNGKSTKKPPVEPESMEPEAQHLHDETKRPLKAPVGGVPSNLPKQFPGKGPKHFSQMSGKGRLFRHQGR
jgi:hypothetical protein